MWKNSCYIVEQILPGSKWNPMDKSVNRRRQNYDKISLYTDITLVRRAKRGEVNAIRLFAQLENRKKNCTISFLFIFQLVFM